MIRIMLGAAVAVAALVGQPAQAADVSTLQCAVDSFTPAERAELGEINRVSMETMTPPQKEKVQQAIARVRKCPGASAWSKDAWGAATAYAFSYFTAEVERGRLKGKIDISIVDDEINNLSPMEQAAIRTERQDRPTLIKLLDRTKARGIDDDALPKPILTDLVDYILRRATMREQQLKFMTS